MMRRLPKRNGRNRAKGEFDGERARAVVSGASQADRERVKKRIRRYDQTSEQFYPFVQESQ